MGITINGNPLGSGTPGPSSVGSLEIIDDSVESIDIQDGTITVADLAFDPFGFNYTVLNVSGNIDPSSFDTVLVDTTLGPVIATLPLAPVDKSSITVKWVAGGSPVTINGNGTNIDGSASLPILEQYHSLALFYSSSFGEWHVT